MITDLVIEAGKHCIETQARKTHEKLISRYFKKISAESDNQSLEHCIEGLRFFLENADFGYLRSAYSDLDGGQPSKIVLNIPEMFYDIKIICGEKNIIPKWKARINNGK